MGYKIFVQKGHVFEADSDGTIVNHELGDYHDGPFCVSCKNFFCRNCEPDVMKEECPAYEETLPGLGYDEVMDI